MLTLPLQVADGQERGEKIRYAQKNLMRWMCKQLRQKPSSGVTQGFASPFMQGIKISPFRQLRIL